MKNDSSLTPRQRYWLGHLRACEASGLSVLAYARREGLKTGSLYTSRTRLSERQLKSLRPFDFVQVKAEQLPRMLRIRWTWQRCHVAS